MTIRQQLTSELKKVLLNLGISEIDPQVDYPADPKHGDYATNVALIAAKKLGKNPMEVGEEIVGQWKMELGKWKIEVVPPGFINFFLSEKFLIEQVGKQETGALQTSLTGKKVMVEFAHPNTHKAFHIGHLRNITVAESIIRLLEQTGTTVIRVNYRGDVGMHIAKALYALLHLSDIKMQVTKVQGINEKVALLGKAYAAGSKAFDEDESAKQEIGKINKQIYARDPMVFDLYQKTRQWSLDYFESIYQRVGSHFDRYYFESEAYETGKETVLLGLKKGIFAESNGAIIFPGSKYSLHDRVFITGEGDPTYEGKDVGLAPIQFKEYHPDLIMHVVGPEQAGYFQVVFEALAQLYPDMRGKEKHLPYGFVKLKQGKMSSRTGNVVLGEWLLDEAKRRILETYAIPDVVAEQVAVGAVKYSFLKVGLSQEIAFDLNESISLEGNSGPYIQYTYARTQSVLHKGEGERGKGKETFTLNALPFTLNPEERNILRLLIQFPEIVQSAAERYAPNMLCTYLFDLAQAFNLFYQKHAILQAEEPVRGLRLFLTGKTGEVIKQGLYLLGIQAPEKM